MRMTTGIQSVSIPVADQDRALAFYTEVLGCELRHDVEVWPGARAGRSAGPLQRRGSRARGRPLSSSAPARSYDRLATTVALTVRGIGMIGAMRLWHRCVDAG
jgi:catechol 2,3-dioxygenase-like lactoylglutathione lyase family enzyme